LFYADDNMLGSQTQICTHTFSIHTTTQVRDLRDVRLDNTPGGSC
jgi:hypothetical protein